MRDGGKGKNRKQGSVCSTRNINTLPVALQTRVTETHARLNKRPGLEIEDLIHSCLQASSIGPVLRLPPGWDLSALEVLMGKIHNLLWRGQGSHQPHLLLGEVQAQGRLSDL